MIKLFPLGTIALLLLTGCSVADSLYYYPTHEVYNSPVKDGLISEKVTFKSADGTQLSGLFLKSSVPARGTVLHFHGNGANLSAQYSFVSWLTKYGFNVFEFDYRGYGDSQGSPYREGVYQDAVAAARYLKTRTDIDQTKIIFYGQSLGAALVLRVAGENHFDGLVGVVEESGFATYHGVAHAHYWILGDLFVWPGHEPVNAAAKISPVPLVVIHGTADSVVPYAQGQEIFDAAKEPKQFWPVEGGGHLPWVSGGKDALKAHLPKLLNQFNQWVGAPPEEMQFFN